MIAPFKISIDEIKNLCKDVVLKAGKGNSSIDYNALISFVRGVNDILDGSKLQKNCFPLTSGYDVFISHAHGDEQEAMLLTVILAQYGLKCFVDEMLWGNSNNLLKAIDNDYSWTDNTKKLYSYSKRNYSTSHVHAMLSIALLEAINNSHFFFFIESKNSLNLKDGIEQQTLSPWLFEELAFANRIQREDINVENRVKFYTEGVCNRKNLQLKVAYDVQDLTDFQSISAKDISSWQGKDKDAIYKDLIKRYPKALTVNQGNTQQLFD